MRDGQYDVNFSAGGHSGRGHGTVDRDRLHGNDHLYRFEGTVVDGKAHVTSHLTVTMQPEFVHNRHVPGRFSVHLSGVANDAGFSLIGTGPLGLIIALDGVRNGAAPGAR